VIFFVFHFIIGCEKKYDEVTLTSPNSWVKITITKQDGCGPSSVI